MNLTTAANASLLMATEPLLTIALGRVVLGEKFTRRKLAAFIIGASGSYLLIAGGWRFPGFQSGHLVGGLVFVLGLGAEAAYSVFGKSLLARHSPELVTMATIAASLLFWLPLVTLQGATQSATAGVAQVTFASIMGIVYLALGCTVFAYWAWFRALRVMDAGVAAQTLFIQPLWGALLSYLLLGESISAATLAGGVWVMLSLYLAIGLRHPLGRLSSRATAGEIPDAPRKT